MLRAFVRPLRGQIRHVTTRGCYEVVTLKYMCFISRKKLKEKEKRAQHQWKPHETYSKPKSDKMISK